MTADRRWPWMHPIDGRQLPGLDTAQSREVTRWAKVIAGRTTLHAWWNAKLGAVSFCLRADTPTAGVVAPKVLSREKILQFPETDWVCRTIYSARKPAKLKDREIESATKSGENSRREHLEKQLADSRPDRLDRARSLVRNRVSVLTP